MFQRLSNCEWHKPYTSSECLPDSLFCFSTKTQAKWTTRLKQEKLLNYEWHNSSSVCLSDYLLCLLIKRRPNENALKLRKAESRARIRKCKNSLLLQLTPCFRVHFYKLILHEVVKKFPAFYGTRRLIPCYKKPPLRSVSWARRIHFTTPNTIFSDHFIILL
jgi:hypothetical protein